MATNNNSSANNKGRALLFEHLPEIKFRQSGHGVLFIIFSNGEAFFYPLESATNIDVNFNKSALLLSSNENPTTKKTSRESNPSKTPSVVDEANRYTVYDAPLSLSQELNQIYVFPFFIEPNKEIYIPPRKILLSPNKRFILFLGALYQQHRALLVYQIIEEPDFFRLIFHDFSFSFIDACFSHDSQSLVVIPSKFPNYIFMLHLPPISNNSSNSTNSNNAISPINRTTKVKSSSFYEKNKMISFEARKAGPFAILGPAKGSFGQALKMTHISCNGNQSVHEYFHFVTWNDDGIGEYCLWKVILTKDTSNSETELTRYEYYPKLCVPRIYDRNWLEEPDTPKNYILDIQFSNREYKLLLVVKRENYGKKGLNGIGLQMVKLETEVQQDSKQNDIYWFQVTDEIDREIYCVKWTNTLLLGSIHAAAVIIKEKGMFELVDMRYGSSFQELHNLFLQTVCNFVQVGRFHRFWLTSNGSLRVIVVIPQIASSHPEWSQIFVGNSPLIDLRHIGRRIGYYIKQIEKDSNFLEAAYLNRKNQKKDKPVENVNFSKGEGLVERYCGLHLYRCWHCKAILLKPLLCSRCRSAVYCSKVCQKADWEMHHINCFSSYIN